jgi:hypothetical protein
MRQPSRFAGRYRLQERVFTEIQLLKFTKPRDEDITPKMWECGEPAYKDVASQGDILIYSQQVSEWFPPCNPVEHETCDSSANASDAQFVRAQSAGAGSGVRSRG